MLSENLLDIYATQFRENWELPAVSNYASPNVLTYADLSRKIAMLHIFFEECGVKRGDKIALMDRSSAEWVLIYMATITYGAIIVPVLSEFNSSDATHIINHSDSLLLFVGRHIHEQFDFDNFSKLKAVISTDGSEVLDEHPKFSQKATRALANLHKLFTRRYPHGFSSSDVKYPSLPPDSVAEINYTSGTTGFSKGVMLTLNNLCGNVVFGIRAQLYYRGSRSLSFLPLAHAYGCAFNMLVPLAQGTHVVVFDKTPTPKLLVKALSTVKPATVITVPLILEKIYRKQILPKISTPSMRRLLAIPLLNKSIYAKIRRSIMEAFGGEMAELIVGGAPLNKEVEKFMLKIKIPLTVGYGMTECGPLISYTPYQEYIEGSAGRTLYGLMQSKTMLPDGESAASEPMATVTGGVELPLGEICVKGENVMKGYYKNPEATAAAIDSEGWLHTGDMGCVAPDGTIFIKGRYKTMILGASGQNIYPEEIEAKLNNMPFVNESLIVERGPKLVALVYPDYEAMDKANVTSTMLPQIMEQVTRELNSNLAPYEQISHIQLIPNEFEKTPKRSIKRFLYK